MVERAYPWQYLKEKDVYYYFNIYTNDFIKGFLVGLALGIGISALIISVISILKK